MDVSWQIENEYGPMEYELGAPAKAYTKWAAQMAVGLGTGVPWIMCKQDDAPDPIVSFTIFFSWGDISVFYNTLAPFCKGSYFLSTYFPLYDKYVLISLSGTGPVFLSYPLSVVFMWFSLIPSASGVAMRLYVGPEWYQFFSLMHMAGLCVFLYPICYDLSLFSGLPLNFVLIDWWPYLLVYWNYVSISSPMVCCLHKTVFYSFPVWILHKK